MSTEDPAVQTPDMAGKKQKKGKGSADNSVKKRKREEEAQAAGENQTAEPEKKKSKKRKSKGGEEAPSTTGAAEEAPQAETPKSSKKEEGKAVAAPATSAADEAAPAKKDKKKKRKSSAEDATGVADSQSKPAEKPSQPAAPESPANAFRGEKKKIKKTKKNQQKDSNDELSAQTQRDNDRPLSTVAPTAESDEVLQSHSPFVQQTASFYLALSPCANSFPLEGLCAEHISPLLLTYYGPLKGIVLSYDNARLSASPEEAATMTTPSSRDAQTILAKSTDEYAVTFVWLTADFVLFRPQKGTYLEGYVNLQNESLLGLVCYNYFNAGIEWNSLPKDWQWVSDEEGALTGKGKGKKATQEGEGHWVDAEGKKVDGRLIFRVKDFEATPGSEGGAGSINIVGTLLSEVDEKALEEGESRS
ncbi:hypothetical protein KC332_g5717 [Hortaea werneckii]|uniref:DNA-directed RNA polymerase subunit n=2 Tax=Hortaea werneckii TaxID=91943 RepID=A0A3M7IS48_HORWE|nr:hypothetical protein KC358_g5316 [Hortaea werneckii]KAI6844347.1 hypothetical protein KC350_g4815 [Hortaea werneckii]KAI6937162.1 hypothetical protein KC348_g5831 [Hortaea werneckii]KAI6937629.1 hypothetical protein KC341_g5442 [Hortaea werneckii]KAI6969461.1 hypothetical protein KC321_g7880 [Hortaea werneckii]